MALFGSKDKETKEEKQQRKALETMTRFSLQDLPAEYQDAVKNIALELSGNSMMETGAFLSGMKTEDTLKISYEKAIMQQNFIIIRQLNELISLMKVTKH